LAKNHLRFREFIARFSLLLTSAPSDEHRILTGGGKLLRELISEDDWLPDAFAIPSPESYRQFLLYSDPWLRFSVVSFVWGPAQRSPIHDHTVWGLAGVMRGAELCYDYAEPVPGEPMRIRGEQRIAPRQIDRFSPTLGDVHAVANALSGSPSVTIQVSGGNIGALRRHVYDGSCGVARPFVSGYDNLLTPNFWKSSGAPPEMARP
jgi:predicted metal-dependent enzyme (double-stranded beta helix superfamily)